MMQKGSHTTMSGNSGEIFQRESAYTREGIAGRKPDRSKMAEPYKVYPGASKTVLPIPELKRGKSFTTLLRIRKSIRKFSTEPVALESLSYLLWAADGICRCERGFEFRTAPSAGALYPVETYLVVNNAEAVAPGIYHYHVREHSLELIRAGSFGDTIADLTLGQRMCASATAVFIWTAIFDRSKWKSVDRTYRNVYLDAGHIAQNLALAACNLGMGSCQIGSFFDEELNSLIGIDGEHESAIYITVVGHPSE